MTRRGRRETRADRPASSASPRASYRPGSPTDPLAHESAKRIDDASSPRQPFAESLLANPTASLDGAGTPRRAPSSRPQTAAPAWPKPGAGRWGPAGHRTPNHHSSQTETKNIPLEGPRPRRRQQERPDQRLARHRLPDQRSSPATAACWRSSAADHLRACRQRGSKKNQITARIKAAQGPHRRQLVSWRSSGHRGAAAERLVRLPWPSYLAHHYGRTRLLWQGLVRSGAGWRIGFSEGGPVARPRTARWCVQSRSRQGADFVVAFDAAEPGEEDRAAPRDEPTTSAAPLDRSPPHSARRRSYSTSTDQVVELGASPTPQSIWQSRRRPRRKRDPDASLRRRPGRSRWAASAGGIRAPPSASPTAKGDVGRDHRRRRPTLGAARAVHAVAAAVSRHQSVAS